MVYSSRVVKQIMWKLVLFLQAQTCSFYVNTLDSAETLVLILLNQGSSYKVPFILLFYYGYTLIFFACFILFSLQDMVYYKLSHVDGRITNPEQRIASDVPRFCSELSDLVQEDLIAVTDGILYAWRLCSYASPKYIFWILVNVVL